MTVRAYLAALLLPLSAAPANADEHAPACAPIQGSQVVLRGTVSLQGLSFEGETLHELSGLAWEESTQTLYAVSDRGILIRMRAQFEQQGTAPEHLAGVQPLQAAVLLDQEGSPLEGAYRDSEGLTLAADGTLLVSFERHPRICAYRPDGHHVGCRELRADLQDPESYRRLNLGLEALTLLEGRLMTGPEAPFEGPKGHLHLYAAEHESVAPVMIPTHQKNGQLTGLATLPDGGLLILERRKTFFPTHTPAAVHVYHPRCSQRGTHTLLSIGGKPLPDATGGPMPQLPAHKDWPIANYEGIAVRDAHHFFLVSDDHGFSAGRLLYVEWRLGTPGAD